MVPFINTFPRVTFETSRHDICHHWKAQGCYFQTPFSDCSRSCL